VIKGCNIFWVQKLALWEGTLLCNKKNLESRDPLSESEEPQSWGRSKIKPLFLMLFDGLF
jgi:hypothetical protein